MSVKTPRFSGPFKWSALRQQLLSLRDDIHTIRKVAGRNVTIDEHRGKGKVINVTDTSSRRPGSGPPPSGCVASLPSGCAMQVCFNFKPDQSEVDDAGSSGYAFMIMSTGWWPDYTTNQWTFDGVDTTVTLPFTGTIGDTQHAVNLVYISNSDDTVTSYMIVDGVESDHMTDSSDLFDDGSGWSAFQVGSRFPSAAIAHREIGGLEIVSTDTANFPDGIIINATGSAVVARVSPTATITSNPPDTHTTFTGTTISFSGGVWRVDTDDPSESVFAEFDFQAAGDPRAPVGFRCCCKTALDELSSISTITLDFAITGLCECGDITLTKTWSRVSIDTVPEDEEFRFICDNSIEGARRATIDAGGPVGHGGSLRLVSNDYPNVGDFIQVDVVLGDFTGSPDYEQPICRWSVQPCITSGLTCVATSSWNSGTTYAATALVSYIGLIYISLQDGNLNHTPADVGDPGWWDLFGDPPHFPCSCTESPDFCLDTTLLDISDVPGEHTYTDTDRACGSITYTTTWTIIFS